MGKKKNKRNSKIIQFDQNGGGEKTKYVLPIHEFDMHFLQLNYKKLIERNNDNAMPVWSVQPNIFDNNYYEFEILGESDGNSNCGIISAAVEMSNKISTESDPTMNNTVTQLKTVNEEIDFTTYMKLVNVFNETDVSTTGSATKQVSSLKDSAVIAKTVDHNTTAKLVVMKNNEHQVILRVSSGEEVKVSMNNFHGFWTSGDSVQCRVCMIMVNDVEAHKMEIRHMKRIAPILKDAHCIRKIGPIFNHCVLCNEIIENIEFHLNANEAHTEHLDEALKLCKSTTASQNNTINSDLLNEPGVAGTSTSDNSTIQSTIDSYRTALDKSLTLNAKSPIDKKLKEAEFSTKPAAVKHVSTTNASNDLVFCDVCDRKMHINTVKSHIEGNYHKTELLKKSKHKESAALRKNCVLPSVSGERNVTSNQYPVHENFASNKHVNENLKMNNDTLREKDSANREHEAFDTDKRAATSNDSIKNVYCTVCDRTMYINQVQSHEEGKYHKKMQMLDKKIKEEIAEIKTKKSHLKCELRPTSPPKSFDDKVQKNLQICYHDGDRYGAYLNKQQFHDNPNMQRTDTNSPDNISTKSTRSTPDIEKIKYLMKEVKNPNFLECRVCLATVPNTFKNALEHSLGTKHYNEYMFLLNRNKIVKRENILYCEACKVSVNVATELVHIGTEYHRNMVATKGNDKNDGRIAASLPKDVAKTEIPDPRTEADIQNKTAYPRDFEDVNSEIKREWRPTSIQESFHDIFQKNLNRRIGNCNGDKYDEIIFKATMDTYAENKNYMSNMVGNRTNIDLNNDMVDSRVTDVVKTEIADPRIQTGVQNIVTDPRAKYYARNIITDPRALNVVVGNNSSIRHGKETERTDVNDYGNINSKISINVTNVQYKYNYNNVQNYSSATEKTNKESVVVNCRKCKETVYFNYGNVKHARDCCMTVLFYKHLISIARLEHRILVYCWLCFNGCNYISNATELYYHITTPDHVNRLRKTRVPIPHISDYRICDLMSLQFNNTLVCGVCEETTDNSIYHVKCHLDSDFHKSKFEKLLLDDKISKPYGYVDRHIYRCEVCHAFLENLEQIYSHINTNNHKQRLNKTKKMTFMQIALRSCGFFLIGFIAYKFFQSQRAVPVPKLVDNTFFEYFGLDFT